MEKNILLTIEYDGTKFSGWQKQPEKRTVQGEIERALSFVCNQDIKINGTSRTDAGVHANGQRANFKADIKIPTDRLKLAVNNILCGSKNALNAVGDVRIVDAEEKSQEFHARFDAKGKKYIYRIIGGGESNIFKRNYAYQISEHLNAEAMQEAAEYMIGKKDFRSFRAAGGDENQTTVRTIKSIEVLKTISLHGVPTPDKSKVKQKQHFDIEVIGDGFLYNMVRIMVGTLVEVGLGKITPRAVPFIIESCDRQSAGHTAPPQGLYLAEVYYCMI